MKKWGLIGIGLFVIVLLIIVYQNIGVSYSTKTVWRDWQGEAKNDGYYLAKKLLKRHHNRVAVITHFPTSTELQENQVFITNANLLPNQEEIAQLKYWIKTGGMLFIPATSSLVENLGGKIKRENRTKEPDVTVWEEQGQRFVVGQFYDCKKFQLVEGESTGKAENAAGCESIHRFQLGKGEIIFLAQPDLWSDGEKLHGMQASEEDIPILQEDRAALFAHLVGEGKNVLWFNGKLGSPSFQFPTRWLIPILLALIFLAFLIWHFGSRFGVLLTFARPQTANLQRHLQASGNLLVSVGAEEALLSASRERLRAELSQNYQMLITDVERLTTALEKDFSLSPILVKEALYHQGGDFVHKMRAIEKIRITIGKIK